MNTLLLLAAIVLLALPAVAAPPVVSNVRAAQLAGTKNIEVLYDVSDADGDLLTIAMQVSGDAGQTYTIPATAVSGHIGAGVASGANRRIIWNAGADWNGQLVSTAKVRVTASDGTTPAPPPAMVYIPAGPFQMGDNFSEVGTEAALVHIVQVDAYFIDKLEVSGGLWQAVQLWSAGHGYNIAVGSWPATNFPVTNVSWTDAALWCNARSEKEGFTPCYYADDAQTLVARSGWSPSNARVKWNASGYRLPTEAEWEKAARGGTLGGRYPWGDSIGVNQANYSGTADPYEAIVPATSPVGYYDGNQTPTGANMVNAFGIYDVAGNVGEWCWDYYQAAYYGYPDANSNPRGPTTSSGSPANFRVCRGGSWNDGPTGLKCAKRFQIYAPNSSIYIGVRCVRGL